jgi:hypothetical protein
MSLQTRETEYVREVRQNTISLWQAYLSLKELQDEWNAQDYGNNLTIDPEGPHAGLLPAQIGAVVFDTANAIATVMAAGNATNVTAIL